ncbi:alpha-L-rhamnosidase [Silvibacterium dinghuense]|nr:alpha-L-rhamnosidase [Silvibacterium dinghuense]
MKWKVFAAVVVFALGISSVYAQQRRMEDVVDLRCDSLTSPLGDDNPHPAFSWKLKDTRIGAAQSAYRVLVASTPASLAKNVGDVWDSGRIEGSQSIGVLYAGPKLDAERRYYWRVLLWNESGKPYRASGNSWWETGLMDASAWRGDWIGYEDPEHAAVRAAHAAWVTNPEVANYKGGDNTRHDLRLSFDLPQAVASATLYATGEDTVAAWVNGRQVLSPSLQPPWGRLPWRTYASSDVTGALHSGANLLAVEALLFGHQTRSQTPMNAVLYVKFADGSSSVFKTGEGPWKSALEASGAWYTAQYQDDGWAAPTSYPEVRDVFGGAGDLGIPLQTPPVDALRKTFDVTKQVRSARLYATALGAYTMSVNGMRAGDQVLSPGWTDFRERVTYQACDVTSAIHHGRNAMGAWLAPGWYSTPLEWVGQGNNYGATPPALKAQLRIEYTDGSVDWVATDHSWKADLSPITSAEIYNGENYDARRDQTGWNMPAFDDHTWHAAVLVHPREPEIVWQSFQPIHAEQTVAPKSVSSPAPGVFIYDFGQNLAGVARIQVQGPAGTDVRLRFGELLNHDGTLYVENLRNAKATDHYILAGKGVETYQPSFTFHGFRYLEITGISAALAKSAVNAVVLHTDALETTKLETGSPMINQLWSNILWGQRSNFVGVPTDCPQRDERLGWTADAQVFWRTASYNMDLAAFSRKYATDLRGTQAGTTMYGIYAPGTSKPNTGFGPGWSDAGVIVPWTSWMQTGDLTILEQNWDAMQRYLDGIHDANPDYLWAYNGGIAFGDWLAPEGATSQTLIATAYWAYDVSLMQQMAHALGRTRDEQAYAQLFEKIRAAFEQQFVHPNGVVGWIPESSNGSGAKPLQETQTGYVLALHMHLLPEADRFAAAQHLVDRIAANGWKLGTGFLGTPYLLEVLSDTGHADVAYRLLLNTQYPSWGYMVEHGATTMWERWNGDQMLNDPGMNSFNHYAYGAVAEWIYRYAAGVDTSLLAPGFHVINLHPNFDARLGHIDFSYESAYGLIHSSWATAPAGFHWTVTIPANTSGRLSLTSAEIARYSVDGKALSVSSLSRTPAEDGKTVFTLPAGTHTFEVAKAM